MHFFFHENESRTMLLRENDRNAKRATASHNSLCIFMSRNFKCNGLVSSFACRKWFFVCFDSCTNLLLAIRTFPYSFSERMSNTLRHKCSVCSVTRFEYISKASYTKYKAHHGVAQSDHFCPLSAFSIHLCQCIDSVFARNYPLKFFFAVRIFLGRFRF